ncbi:MAG: hypothetical protein DMG59_13785 [Acidobacteria bacterium]|jgi:hypothetical protein|nr:MAG: hypothetical protein DMG59_13785 [Acidobacteriota bacterium]
MHQKSQIQALDRTQPISSFASRPFSPGSTSPWMPGGQRQRSWCYRYTPFGSVKIRNNSITI